MRLSHNTCTFPASNAAETASACIAWIGSDISRMRNNDLLIARPKFARYTASTDKNMRSTSCTTVTIVAYQRETAKSGEGLIHPTCLAGVLRKVCNTNQKMWYLSLMSIVYTKNIVHKYHTYHTCISVYIYIYIHLEPKQTKDLQTRQKKSSDNFQTPQLLHVCHIFI